MGVMSRTFAPLREARGVPRWIVWAGIIITVFFIFLAVAAPLVSPYDFNEYRTVDGERFGKQQAPSGAHPFGTTVQQTDVMARVIFGARTALTVVFLALLFSLVVGVPLGLVSGYSGGRMDRVLVLVMDALFAFPPSVRLRSSSHSSCRRASGRELCRPRSRSPSSTSRSTSGSCGTM